MEPGNVSIYTTLGQVYDKIYQDQVATDPVAADSMFDKSLYYYQQALTKDASNFDAVYSIGALWYNKAASYSTQLNELANDLSPAGNKKYDAVKMKMDEAFSKAMPYFAPEFAWSGYPHRLFRHLPQQALFPYSSSLIRE